MTFIYLDKAGHLHGTKESKTAAEFSRDGRFYPAPGYDCKNGYVVMNNKEITEKEMEAEVRKGLSALTEIYKKLK